MGQDELPLLLQIFREDVGGLSGRDVARHLGVTPAAVSQWERGHRGVRFATLRRLDELYGAQGALVDLTMALDARDGLAARDVWAQNFPGPSGPAWAWLRPRPGTHRIEARLRWAAFHLAIDEACDDRGLVATTPMSMENPAVWVYLREAGWVDFGRGEVPERLGLPCFDALERAEVAGGGHSAAGLVSPRLAERFARDERFAARLADFFGSRPELVEQVCTTGEAEDRVSDLTDGRHRPADAPDPFPAEGYRRLRVARRLTRQDVADLATGMRPDAPVTTRHLELLEAGGDPRPDRFRSRLDRIYRADGTTCTETVTIRTKAPVPTFDFPTHWIGPIWFRFVPTDDRPARLAIHHGENRKELLVRGPTIVTCRRPTEDAVPFTVTCPRGWTVEVGLGAWGPEARDVNFGWQGAAPPDPATAAALRADRPPIDPSFLGWFGRTPEDLAELLDGEGF